MKIYDLIKKYEGFKSEPYLCPVGCPTIGYGTTYYESGARVKLTDKPITEDRACQLLEWYCKTQIKLPKGDFTDEQKASLCSLIYNIGNPAFDKSKCKAAIEAKDWQTAYNNWDWVTAGGKVLKGLVRRRNEEKALFFKDLL